MSRPDPILWVKRGDNIDKLKKFKRAFFVLIGVIVLFLFIPIKENVNPDNIRYVLSSISQGLFALLALAVTLPIIFTQLLKLKSTNNESKNSNKSTIFLDAGYLVFFGISIILPLIILVTTCNDKFNFNWVKISLSFASYCVYLVIESFLRFKKKLEMWNRIKDLGMWVDSMTHL